MEDQILSNLLLHHSNYWLVTPNRTKYVLEKEIESKDATQINPKVQRK